MFRMLKALIIVIAPVGIGLLFHYLKVRNGMSDVGTDEFTGTSFVEPAKLNAQMIARKPLDYRWFVMPNRSMEIRKLLQKNDKSFYPIPMMDMAKELFLKLQECWVEGNTANVANDLHPDYYAKLNDMVSQGYNPLIRMHIENITFHNFYLTFYKQDKENVYVTVYLESQMIRYAEDAATGEVVSGSISEREESVNLMKFVRPVGATSETDKWLLCDFTLSIIGVKDEKIVIEEG